jgi:hypothetical protein
LNAEDIRDGGPQGEATGRVITLRLPLHPLVALFSGCAGAEPAFWRLAIIGLELKSGYWPK